jgi:hypothetical protein
MFPMQDASGYLNAKYAGCTVNSGAPIAITAAGTGDATAVTGETLDRYGTGAQSLADHATVVLPYLAALTAAKTLSLAVEYQTSADGSSWDTAVALQASTVAATGAGNIDGALQFNVDLSGLKRYFRVNYTPDLSNTATDTAIVMAVVVFSGYKDSSDA